MHRRRWLVVGLCFCIFSGCKTCQSVYDYCGPMPEEGGDFMYRKNSVLGGDPAMTRADGEPAENKQGAEGDETGPEPTPAPPPDEEPRPGLEMDDSTSYLTPETAPEDEESDELLNAALLDNTEDVEVADVETVNSRPMSALDWHSPSSRGGQKAVTQARFRND